MSSQQTVLVAVAWPYANGPRHIGHVAGFGVPADIYARYHRLAGHDVLMVSGTDEHGTPITVEAEKLGLDPREFADRNNDIIVKDLQKLGLTYDLFTRTTTANHYAVVQDLFRTLYENGAITKQTALGAFAAGTDRALPDRYIEGTCPICGYGSARGDQCDNCGNQLDPTDLIEPRSRIDGQPPEFRETEHFFLDLGQFSERLHEWIGASDWRPNVKTFSINLLDELRARAITRDIDWGVPIPLEGYGPDSTKRIYVWFDAVIGYLSASIEWAAVCADDPKAWQRWWTGKQATGAYFMGKDNIVFHSVIWPSILMGYGPGPLTDDEGPLDLPTDIVSSEYLTMESAKFSSSRGVVIFVKDFLDRYDPDPLRYYLCAAGPETQDTDFTWSEFVRRNDEELVATWGNLVNRCVSMTHKNFGSMPPLASPQPHDLELIAKVEAGYAEVGALIERTRFKLALSTTMALAADVNRYLSDEQPWKLFESDMERAGTVLHVGLQCVANLCTMFAPFLPFTSAAARGQLGLDADAVAPQPHIETVGEGDDRHQVIRTVAGTASWSPVSIDDGTPIGPPRPLFRKLGATVVEEELARLGQ